jgi:hypothetical protein
VLHFPASEHHGQANFIALSQEFAHLVNLDLEIVVADARTHPQLFDLAAAVPLASLLDLFFALVAKFGKIGQLTNRRIVLGRDFNKV